MSKVTLVRFLAVGMFLVVGCNRSGPASESTASPAPNTPATSPGNSAPMTPEANANSNSRSNPTPPNSYPAPPPVPRDAAEARAASPMSRGVVVAAGTPIEVTVDQAISSKNENAGDRFNASLAAAVIVNGRQAIPAGARASVVVSDAKSAGKFNGNAELTVTLDRITVHGRSYSVKTSTFTDSGKGRGKRTAIGAGGGAALGAIIGAIAGGGKGAAIGAGAGAGAGTAGAVFTGDRDVTISPETHVTFKLRAPLDIAE